MAYPDLHEWWASGTGQNAWTTLRFPTGEIEVYVRRCIADRDVMMIANVGTVSGFGGARRLYRTVTRDIPTIAELVINPDLDALLVRWGWDHAYRDQMDTPTRVNKAFRKRFPLYEKAQSPLQAIVMSR